MLHYSNAVRAAAPPGISPEILQLAENSSNPVENSSLVGKMVIGRENAQIVDKV